MKKMQRRTASVLAIVLLLLCGLSVYVFKYCVNGAQWGSSVYNKSVYSNGRLCSGDIYDRDGVLLAGVEDGKRYFASDSTLRKATLHVVGDKDRNIGTGALTVYARQLTGFNHITGTYSFSGDGGKVKLSIDADLNRAAYKALDGRSGVVAVANYETGEVLCCVSSPGFDPSDPPEISADDKSGVYLNRFLSSTFTPGSIFKVVTAAAAIEKSRGINERSFNCDGSLTIGGDKVTCTHAHGRINFEQALAVSCNCAFARLSLELGSDNLYNYADRYGLLSGHDIDGVITTASGRFDKASADTTNLGWSGAGQYNDLVNPAAYLRFMCAVANDGEATGLTLLKNGKTGSSERLMSKDTAQRLQVMLGYDVAYNYGKDNFPGLELCAKSGTAEVGSGNPHAWFSGFITNEGCPYAFIVLVENGGSGASVAGSVANKVLQTAVFGE
ncbi:MAG: penicillin-binding protein [Oscillospiraceae bacterium]|nr:penicillin-binding protein [Oscillospiraceae bacterium]